MAGGPVAAPGCARIDPVIFGWGIRRMPVWDTRKRHHRQLPDGADHPAVGGPRGHTVPQAISELALRPGSRRGLPDSSGQVVVEYAILLALVAVALIGALMLLRDAVGGVYAHTGNQIEQVIGTPADPASGSADQGKKGKGCGDGVGGGKAAGGCAVGHSK